MTTRPHISVVPLSLWLALLSGWGCGSCGQEKTELPVATLPAAQAGADGTAKPAPGVPVAPKGISKDSSREGWMLAVELQDDRVHLWVEGLSQSMERDAGTTRYSASGFDWDVGELVKVMGAGGGNYFRLGEPNHEAQGLLSLFESAGAAPDGYEVSWSVARAGLYQTELRIGTTQKLKLGRLLKNEPIGDSWTEGVLPPGISSPSVSANFDWPREDGEPIAMLPEGAEEIQAAASEELERVWTEDATRIRGDEVTLQQSLVADLDRDGEEEGVICVSGGSGDYTCFVIDHVGSERRYFGLNLGLREDAPLMAFAWNESHYLAWVGRINRSSQETDAPLLHLVRFDGGGFPTDIIR